MTVVLMGSALHGVGCHDPQHCLAWALRLFWLVYGCHTHKFYYPRHPANAIVTAGGFVSVNITVSTMLQLQL